MKALTAVEQSGLARNKKQEHHCDTMHHIHESTDKHGSYNSNNNGKKIYENIRFKMKFF